MLATLATGCQDEDMVVNKPSGEGQQFTLTIGKDIDSRTTLGQNLATLWSRGDQIYVSGDDGKINGVMSLIEGEGASTATFSGLIFGGNPSDLDYVVFPVPDKNNKIDMSLRKADKLDAPMIGTISNGATASLKNVGGLLALKVKGGNGNVYVVEASNSTDGNMTGGYYTFNPTTGKLIYTPVDNPVSTEVINGLAYVPVATTLAATDGSNTSTTFVTVNVVVTEGNDDTPITSGEVTVTGGKIMGDEANESVPSFSVDAEGKTTAVTTVYSEDDLISAVYNEEVESIELTGGISLTQTLEIKRDLVLDLGGFAINGDENLGTAIKVTGGNFTLENGELAVFGEGIHIDGRNQTGEIVVNIKKETFITSQNDCCVYIKGDTKTTDYANVTVNTEGELTSNSYNAERNKMYAAIQANGNTKNLTLNVKGGRITSYNTTGIYFPCTTTLNITGGIIEGYTAVYQKSGNLTISGESTELRGNGEYIPYTYNDNGCNDTGDALIVETCNYPGGAPTISITGGNFFSEHGNAIGSYAGNGVEKPLTGFISGGYFSDPSGAYHMSADANIDICLEKNYEGPGFKVAGGQSVHLVLKPDVVYNVINPLVGSAGTETLGFQFLRDSEVIIEGEGIITSSVAKMLINNYGNLELNNITLHPEEIPDMKGTNEELQNYYVLSNNCGNVTLRGATIIVPEKHGDVANVFAMDVCQYASYPGVDVHVTKASTINGDIEYTGVGKDQSLEISSSTINGDLVIGEGKADAAKEAIFLYDAILNGEGWDIIRK